MTNEHPKRIAIVDDEDPIRRALRRLLSSTGYEVRAFPGGAEFFASLAEEVPDCVILDLHMPIMDGFAVLERLSREAPGVPVLVITGFDTPQSRERALAAGANAYLRKPIDGQQLINAIQEVAP